MLPKIFIHQTSRIYLFIIFLSFNLTTYGNNTAKQTLKQAITIKPFSKLNISGFAKVILKQGDNYSMTIEANERMIRYIKTNTQEGTLNINMVANELKNHKITSYTLRQRPDNKLSINTSSAMGTMSFIEITDTIFFIEGHSIYKTSAKKLEELITLKITAPYIESIKIDGRIHMIFSIPKNNNYQSKLDIEVKGNAHLDIKELYLKRLNINLRGASITNIEKLDTKYLTLKSSNASSATLDDAHIKNCNLNFTDSTSIKIQNLISQNSKIKLRDSSNLIAKNLDINTLNMDLTVSSLLKIEKLLSHRMVLNQYGTSDVKIYQGKIDHASIFIKDSANLTIPKVIINEVNIKAYGIGKAILNIIKKLSMDVTQTFKLTYTGTPKIVSKNKKIKKKLKAKSVEIIKKLQRKNKRHKPK